jgi:hypothetical protein
MLRSLRPTDTMPTNRCVFSLLTILTLVATPTLADAQQPLASGDWTQVGNMVADGNLFNGNCNLDLSGACTFDSATDYWHPMANANQILFITGDRQYWGHAWYGDVRSIIQGATGDFTPNLKWIDAGRGGVSVGAITGNVLFRLEVWGSPPEDPWVTLEGPHCANVSTAAPCSEIVWGENTYPRWDGNSHTFLQMNHGGLEVWAREYNASQTVVPEPSTIALVAAGLLGLGWRSHRLRRWAANV